MQCLIVRVSLAAIAAALALSVPTVNADERHRGRVCDAERIEAQLVDASGYGVICVTGSGLYGTIAARGLVPGHAYTVWWVYFDDPASCVGGAIAGAEDRGCGGPDFAGDNPLGVFGRMDSGVAPRSGRVTFSGRVRGFKRTKGAEVWMWIFGHGPADDSDGRHRARQLLTPEDPSAGMPHLGNSVDGPLGFPAGFVRFYDE